MRSLFLIAVLLLAGCATRIERQVEGWPTERIKVRVHENVGFLKVQQLCWGYVPLWRKMLGHISSQCTVVNLDALTCDVYTIEDPAIEHEFEHCRGGDHDGTLQRVFNIWQSKQLSTIR